MQSLELYSHLGLAFASYESKFTDLTDRNSNMSLMTLTDLVLNMDKNPYR